MSVTLVPEGERLGNFRQGYRGQTARLLFYGGRPLGPVVTSHEEAAAVFCEDADRIFLGTAVDMQELVASGAVPAGLKVLYRAGDLVLFGLQK
jgi:hypothetical protein